MPNTPAQVGVGAAAFCRGTHATDQHAGQVMEFLGAAGYAVELPETLLDAVTGKRQRLGAQNWYAWTDKIVWAPDGSGLRGRRCDRRRSKRRVFDRRLVDLRHRRRDRRRWELTRRDGNRYPATLGFAIFGVLSDPADVRVESVCELVSALLEARGIVKEDEIQLGEFSRD